MATNPHSPLNDQHLSDINQALITIDRAEAQILLATQAGIDVSLAKQQLDSNKERLLKIKRVYFPNS